MRGIFEGFGADKNGTRRIGSGAIGEGRKGKGSISLPNDPGGQEGYPIAGELQQVEALLQSRKVQLQAGALVLVLPTFPGGVSLARQRQPGGR